MQRSIQPVPVSRSLKNWSKIVAITAVTLLGAVVLSPSAIAIDAHHPGKQSAAKSKAKPPKKQPAKKRVKKSWTAPAIAGLA